MGYLQIYTNTPDDSSSSISRHSITTAYPTTFIDGTSFSTLLTKIRLLNLEIVKHPFRFRGAQDLLINSDNPVQKFFIRKMETGPKDGCGGKNRISNKM